MDFVVWVPLFRIYGGFHSEYSIGFGAEGKDHTVVVTV
jgi:hypothetical protein